MQEQINFCDILMKYGPGYIQRNNIKGQEKGIINLLSVCGTEALGSHYMQCDQCGHLKKSYNSCRNRHCPDCQQKDKQEWLEKRMKELLPVGYYHLVFTIPHQLNALCQQNKKIMYDILFKAASQTVIELARDARHLGAETGLVTILHTWGQNMMEHPHLHCIMPGGGLSFDSSHWVSSDKRNKFFVHYKVLSRKFRGKFLDFLEKAYSKGTLVFKGDLLSISGIKNFTALISKLYHKEWVVNIQAPIGKPDKVLEYLSRYVFRIAITNRRILEVKQGKVLFSWKDYRTGLYRKMILDVDEFIRRFLLHLLPEGFFKVRYYGIFSSRHRKKNIEISKALIEEEKALEIEQTIEDKGQAWVRQQTVWDEILQMILAYRPPNCPCCKKGRMVFAGIVPRSDDSPG